MAWVLFCPWIKAEPDIRCPLTHAIRLIELKQKSGRSAFRRAADDHAAFFNTKLLGLALDAWIEQPYEITGLWIICADI
jgi:hypothetical protein